MLTVGDTDANVDRGVCLGGRKEFFLTYSENDCLLRNVLRILNEKVKSSLDMHIVCLLLVTMTTK